VSSTQSAAATPLAIAASLCLLLRLIIHKQLAILSALPVLLTPCSFAWLSSWPAPRHAPCAVMASTLPLDRTAKLRGLPFRAGETDVLAFFNDFALSLGNVYLRRHQDGSGRPNGEVWLASGLACAGLSGGGWSCRHAQFVLLVKLIAVSYSSTAGSVLATVSWPAANLCRGASSGPCDSDRLAIASCQRQAEAHQHALSFKASCKCCVLTATMLKECKAVSLLGLLGTLI
jgi:hypothetical protein